MKLRRLRRGLSIVEVLCAVALLSFLLLPIVQLVLNASADTRRSELHARALFLAQKRLEEALLLPPAEAAALPDDEVERFSVKVDVQPYQGSADLHDLAVTVSWPADRGSSRREVKLRTLLCELTL
ncbi:MAG: hypothetical protein HY816_22900 [Candidatus Wallbacteria bacterium]|nr:hypothetical protein [Candidatus Wallbacteria bacterium]